MPGKFKSKINEKSRRVSRKIPRKTWVVLQGNRVLGEKVRQTRCKHIAASENTG